MPYPFKTAYLESLSKIFRVKKLFWSIFWVQLYFISFILKMLSSLIVIFDEECFLQKKEVWFIMLDSTPWHLSQWPFGLKYFISSFGSCLKQLSRFSGAVILILKFKENFLKILAIIVYTSIRKVSFSISYVINL